MNRYSYESKVYEATPEWEITVFDTSEFQKNFAQDKLLFGEPMSKHTTFKIGGAAKLMLLPGCNADIVAAFEIAERIGAPTFVMGGGSNLLVRDNGLDAVVIKLGKSFSNIALEGDELVAQSGVSLASLAAFAYQHALSGLEFAAGIPGTLGGAVYMNAGAYGEEMSDCVKSAQILVNGEIIEYSNAQLGFSYRTGRIQEGLGVVLSARIQLGQGDQREIAAKMDDLAKRRREKQPLEYPSAGSTFKRPPGNFAGKLIEDAGLKGFRLGGAQVSPKHAGFIINTGGATAADVLNLMEHVQEQVYKCFGIELEPEIRVVGN